MEDETFSQNRDTKNYSDMLSNVRRKKTTVVKRKSGYLE